ncbi:hypothetical protein BJ170DRAFT_700836 [Xylariales sp. AK1849]|nr:hypothetical protein BJ170DRAFT_700836 [Xylariales sp. AK1849]
MHYLHVKLLLVLSLVFIGAVSQDDLGLSSGYITIETANFALELVKDAQVLASLKPAGESFDFLPFDYLDRRARNGQYHWGDITFRYRENGSTTWTDADTSAARQPVTAISYSTDSVLAASNLAPTLLTGPLNITREWLDVSGDLALQVTIQNTGSQTIELGSLGFPAEFNSIFTNRTAVDMAALCSFSDPYIGMHAGHIRVAPVRGNGTALVVTPFGDTPLEAYRNLAEPYYEDTAYESQTFEGFYEWQVLTKAWAENEWSGIEPWNTPSSKILAPGGQLQFGVRFSVVEQGVRGIDNVVKGTGTPVTRSVPGYILPRDLPAQLYLQADSDVTSITSVPDGSLTVDNTTSGSYLVTPSTTAWGRARLIVEYSDGKVQTIHYYIAKPGTEAVANLGNFLTTAQWFNDTSDPFYRAPSPLTYDYEAKSIVEQDSRVWVAGLSDEAGAGSFLAATIKQAVQPNAGEVSKLEAFVDGVLWKTIQVSDYAVRKSIFYYEPDLLPNYTYDPDLDWTSWTSWNKADAYATDRAYDYVHVTAAYWSLYRVGRAYPDLIKSHTWDWYLNQAYNTILRAMQDDVGYNRVGLMGETVFGEILSDLKREGNTSEADALSAAMLSRAQQWNTEEIPYGSEMAWDSTGQEGVYYWSKYFGFTGTAAKTVNSVLGYTPTVPHWGWNGNARRYWDNIYGGKLQRIERQIHHYGSGLNAQVLLAEFRSNPSDGYLLRVGFGGISGPLSSINQDGFAAASFHSWPDTLKWDGISGDYGPNFLGLALGSGTYVVEDEDVGLVAYGGVLESTGSTITVQTRDPVRKRVFIGSLGLLISIDAGIIGEFSYVDDDSGTVSMTLTQLDGIPKAEAAVVWLETTSGSVSYNVKTAGIVQARLGWKIPLSSNSVTISIGPE